MIIENFVPFEGQHCETAATGSLLNFIGIKLSEPLLFGLGEGLGFIYWDMKNMNFPFIGGRIKQDLITENIVRNLGLKVEIKETSSPKIAWENVRTNIDKGIPVGLKLDCYYLDYFTNRIHFAAHYVAMYGYDDRNAYLVDTEQQGTAVQTSLESLALSRNEKGPMSSKNLSFTISKSGDIPDLSEIIPKAIRRNATDFLNPPIKNIGYKGIEKASKEIKRWLSRSNNPTEDLQLTATLMERAGTGGAVFRNIYRDFLKESLNIIERDPLVKAYDMYCEIAKMWTNVSSLIGKAGETVEVSYLNEAAEWVFAIYKKEKEAMELLVNI